MKRTEEDAALHIQRLERLFYGTAKNGNMGPEARAFRRVAQDPETQDSLFKQLVRLRDHPLRWPRGLLSASERNELKALSGDLKGVAARLDALKNVETSWKSFVAPVSPERRLLRRTAADCRASAEFIDWGLAHQLKTPNEGHYWLRWIVESLAQPRGARVGIKQFRGLYRDIATLATAAYGDGRKITAPMLRRSCER